MQHTLRLRWSRPARPRFLRWLRVAILRWLHARLREQSPIVDRPPLGLRGPF